jgi:hypothetical protein
MLLPLSKMGFETHVIDNQTLLLESKSQYSNEYVYVFTHGYVLKNSPDLGHYGQTIIATTESHEDITQLIINEESNNIEKIALDWFVNVDKNNIVFDLGWMKIFEGGYKSNKKEYTQEDIMKAYVAGGTNMHNHCIKHNWKGVYEGYDKDKFNELGAKYIKETQKKELHIEVDFIPTKSNVFYENDNAPIGKYIPKIIDNKLNAYWL